MEFIFMLTRDDRTIPNCLAVYDAVRDLGLRCVGFKDVGADRALVSTLVRRIKADGALSHVELVDPDPERAFAAACHAIEAGVDRLMGGMDAERILGVALAAGVPYHPFPGRPIGHPTRLAGTAEEIAADCRRFAAAGAAGVDLLAYRALDADPIALVLAARAATPGRLIVAGSVNTPERIHAVRAAGADAFTVGSAAVGDDPAAGIAALRARLTALVAAAAA
ncbi:MAG TPA: hypothetical protein VIM86_05755 [Thermodesulfobacteriota bacterium]